MMLTSVYFLNVFCAIVPCSATQPHPEAYIDESKAASNNDIARNAELIDPIIGDRSNFGNANSAFEDNIVRQKRLFEQNDDNVNANNNSRPVGGRDIINSGIGRRPVEGSPPASISPQLNALFPRLFSAVPVIPALLDTFVRNINSGPNNRRAGRQPNAKNIRNSRPPVVYTQYGGIEGYHMGTMKGRKIFAFEGIPYAEPPTGKYRFKAPVPKFPWKDTLIAKHPGSNCLQGHPLHFFRITGSEDCLFMNIFTPQIPDDGKTSLALPVIFLIHGGSFQYGSGSEYGPAYLLDEDVILVTINYRLGPLGFLSTGDEASPGNFGLKDQALALKWVYENIAAFGGENSKITIMGQSAGAVSAHLHLVANKTTQYFHNGVSLSGSGFGFWPIVGKRRSTDLANKLARVLNCPRTDRSSQMVTCLQKFSGAWITAAQFQLYDWIPFHPLVLFAPTVEPEGPEAFLTKTTEEAYERKEVMNKPWIFGQTSQEGYFDVYFMKLMMQSITIALNGRKLLPIILDYAYFTKQPRTSELTNDIIEFYGGSQKGSLTGNGIAMDAIAEMITDRFYTTTIRKAIEAHSKIAPTYAYVFDYKGKYNLGPLFGAQESEWGVSHTEDLFYFFNSSVFHHGLKQSDKEYSLSQILTDVLANFATKGEPTFIRQNEEMSIWKPAITNDTTNLPIQYLSIRKDIEMISDPFQARVAFWDDLDVEKT